MVNNVINVSAYEASPPSGVVDGRINIVGGPLYPAEGVIALLEAGENSAILWTRQCIHDVQQLAFDIEDVRLLIKQAVTQGRYLNSEWCVQKPVGPWAACDAYRLFRDEWVENARKEMRHEYYIKFAIAKTGKLLLIVSCHLSR